MSDRVPRAPRSRMNSGHPHTSSDARARARERTTRSREREKDAMCDRYAFFDAQSWLTPRDDVEEAGDEEEEIFLGACSFSLSASDQYGTVERDGEEGEEETPTDEGEERERGAVELRCASYESENGADSGAREVLGKRQWFQSKSWWRGLEGWGEVYG